MHRNENPIRPPAAAHTPPARQPQEQHSQQVATRACQHGLPAWQQLLMVELVAHQHISPAGQQQQALIRQVRFRARRMLLCSVFLFLFNHL